MTDLTDIDGVGPSYADTLEDMGYDDAESVASADADEVDEAIDTVTGEELIQNAVDATEAVEDPAKEEAFTVDAEFSEAQENHLISAFIDQEVQARRTNDADRLQATQDAIREIREGQPYELTLQQLSIGYTATNQLESEYRSTRGLSELVGQIRDVRNVFQNARQENWPDEDE